jgi:hypothetical protein
MKLARTALALAALTSGLCQAQGTEELVIRERGGAVEIMAKNRNLSDTWNVASAFDLKVTCESVDCSGVTIESGGKSVTGISEGANGRLFKVKEPPEQGIDVTVLLQARKLAKIELMPARIVPQADTSPKPAGSATTLQELLTCIHPAIDFKPYDLEGNYAEFVTNALGTVLGGPPTRDGEVVDEDDTVFVRVLVHPDLYPYLRVKRTSDTRTLGTLNIAGQGVKLERQSEGGEAAARIPVCKVFNARLTDFKAGTGKVRISAQIGDEDKELGTFEFAVSPIYHGILSFGPFTSNVVNDSFKLVESGGQSIIAPGEEGEDETSYAIWYTHFVWGGRDLEKKPRRWYHRINPSIGIVTNHLDEHALAGVSIDLGAFVLVAGSHFARTTVLSRASGLEVGDEFTGAADAIPTATKWKSSSYYGVSVDLRAAAALIKAAFSGAAK